MTATDPAARATRCARCRRRLGNSTSTLAHHDDDGRLTSASTYCRRAACRRALHESFGERLPVSGASTEALGAAVIAGDYVQWPWWARLLPASARRALASEFAERMSAAVEHHVRRRITRGGASAPDERAAGQEPDAAWPTRSREQAG